MLRQVMMSAIAAITHTAFVGRTAAVINPAPKAIAVEQLLHRLMLSPCISYAETRDV